MCPDANPQVECRGSMCLYVICSPYTLASAGQYCPECRDYIAGLVPLPAAMAASRLIKSCCQSE